MNYENPAAPYTYEVEIIDTLEEYYARYPENVHPEDIAAYPQLDPSVPAGRILTRGTVHLGL
jgi:hypothetical protein